MSDAYEEWRPGYNDDVYDRGLVRVAWAARQMGISFEQLVTAARDDGISVAGGIDWADLIPLARKLLVRERDPARRALIANGLKIFIRTRNEDVAARDA